MIKNLTDLIDIDLVTDLKIQEKVLYSKLDTYIRHHMRKVGISIIKIPYSGFDTEFNNTDITRNYLVSAQLAIT